MMVFLYCIFFNILDHAADPIEDQGKEQEHGLLVRITNIPEGLNKGAIAVFMELFTYYELTTLAARS